MHFINLNTHTKKSINFLYTKNAIEFYCVSRDSLFENRATNLKRGEQLRLVNLISFSKSVKFSRIEVLYVAI